MNNPLIVATVAFLLLLPQFNCADAAGPYDGEWKGTATSTGERCKRAVTVHLTVEGNVVLGQAQFDSDTSRINGAVDESGIVGATIGFQSLRGQFTGNEFEATFKILDCQWEAVLRRTSAGDQNQAASSRLKGR
jgi:hypothetical protein